MRTAPLIRRRWSNEHIMAALFIVLLLYLIPRWIQTPSEIPGFVAVLALALLIEAAAGFLRYKRIVCCVSAAVTAAVLQVLTPSIPLWGRLIGITAAIVLGKLVWGGSGKNNLNPAITGLLIISFLFTAGFTPIPQTALIIPALVLSLPFVLVRPYASLGFIAGMLVSVFMPGHADGFSMIITCIFLGCLVMTDPVTITPMKLPGLAGGLLVGFIPLQTGYPTLSFAMVLLIFNLISYLLEDISHEPLKAKYTPLCIKKPFSQNTEMMSDLTNGAISDTEDAEEGTKPEKDGVGEDNEPLADSLTPQMILDKIESHQVYGLGGAGFPTADKIKAVMSSDAKEKYFIINAVECDPGLVHDRWLLRHRTEDIKKGIQIISRCAEFSDVILALKETEGFIHPIDLKVARVGDYYPAGSEKLLIQSVLKKDLPADSIPSKEGILVLNVQTVLSVYEAVCLDKDADEKYITVADMVSGSAKTVKVKAGGSVEDTLKSIFAEENKPVYTGGGLMQAHLAQDTDLIERTTNFIAAAEMPRYKESPHCSKCGQCAAHCPQNLRVQKIAELVDMEKYKEASAYHPDLCIQCGICSYVCLGGRNLSARVAEAKNWMRTIENASGQVEAK